MKNCALILTTSIFFYVLFSCSDKKEILYKNKKGIEITNKDLGLSLEEILKKINIDTAECKIQTEPPGISRGIEIEIDSTILFFQIYRKANFKNKFKSLMKEKVTGIGIAYPDCNKEYFGKDFILDGIENKYCKE